MEIDDSTNDLDQQEQAGSEIAGNLELLKEQLPEHSLARVLVEARKPPSDDPEALQKLIDKRLEQLRESYADTADQDD